MTADGRIPLEFVTAIPVPRSDTLLVVGDGRTPPAVGAWADVTVINAVTSPFAHVAGCLCCTGRGEGIAAALGDIFRRRATGGVKWFTRIIVLPPTGQEAAWRAALAGDVLASARFAICPPGPA